MQIQILDYLGQHPGYVAAISVGGTWVFNNIVSVMVSSLPAPTKSSSPSYTYWFKVLNTIIGNFSRAKSTTLEKSPNWQDAMDQHLENNGLVAIPKEQVQVVVTPPVVKP